MVIITGASRGIGRAVAAKCAELGAIVGANFHRSASCARSLADAYPENIHLLEFDVGDQKAVDDGVGKFVKEFGRVDILVNNAGIGGVKLLVGRADLEMFRACVGTNFYGPIFCSMATLPHMLRQRSGLIINISSVAVTRPVPGQAVYAMTKGAIEALTRALAVEYGRKGVRAVSVRLGPVDTELLRQVGGANVSDLYKDKVYGGKIASPDEIARLIVFLMSPESRYSTGACFSWDGGYQVS